MTSSEIRQSFLDFFRSKGHTIVPSSSLLPGSPNLLFTNAGMNQFVPIFLGQRAPDVDKWPGAIPGLPTRAADTQKCIRAGGKHNDLEEVGLDTYHHTFFEMLGNWSFGDYFKKESLEWGWELLTKVWSFPASRLYATVYQPDKARAEPSEFDQEAYDIWAEIFRREGLDPKVHIVFGGKKDNFWMMGDTGPCGPCSEIHVDLTPAGDTKGGLVNAGSAQCIEIWNHVFIQFNANADGTFPPLPARHVDTGMGFERVTSIIQGTRGFADFANAKISNYETDIFRPIFDALEKLSGRQYSSTLPPADLSTINSQQSTDVAFRVIADHIRTLSFAIADGVQPSNEGRGYVLRRILRRAVRYGRSLGFHEPFFYKLVDVLSETMGHVFPEIRQRQRQVIEAIKREEEAFNKTLDRGITLFENEVLGHALLNAAHQEQLQMSQASKAWWGEKQPEEVEMLKMRFFRDGREIKELSFDELRAGAWRTVLKTMPVVSGEDAFKLYDTYGFPLDLTELMARERGLSVDVDGFEKLMEEQRQRARDDYEKKKAAITIADEGLKVERTQFLGYEFLEAEAVVEAVAPSEKGNELAVVLDRTPFYAEAGGQIGDTGLLHVPGRDWTEVGKLRVIDTRKRGDVHLHRTVLAEGRAPEVGEAVRVAVDAERRAAIQRHHTVTHLLHWALHEVVSKDATQKGSYVGPDKLTFDFSSAPLTPAQVRDVEKLVNERILENAGVNWTEVSYADVKSRKDVMQFFGEKYGDCVRVVQVGGRAGELNGYSMELCGGTHTRATGEIGSFRIASEAAIAAGIRRIEAVAGLAAYEKTRHEAELISAVAAKVNSPVGELEKKLESLLAQQKELEKRLRATQQRQAADLARSLVAKAQTVDSMRLIVQNLGAVDGDFLQMVADTLKGEFKGVVVLAGTADGAVALVATVSPELTKQIQAGKIIQGIAPIVGGKGGGRPDNARGGGKDVARLDEALSKVRELI